jgi:hypothetical protein
MSNKSLPHEITDNDDAEGNFRAGWEVPEVAAVAVVIAVGLLVVGGVVTGIVDTVSVHSRGAETQMAGLGILEGAMWAQPALAAILLGVLGACWWRIQAWSLTGGARHEEEPSRASEHIGRERQIARWVLWALGLTAVGSVALFAGELMDTKGMPAPLWTTDVSVGASSLAVIAIAVAGMWVGRLLRNGSTAKT